MKLFIAISTAFLVCAPAIAHHGPYDKSTEGQYHHMHLRGATVTPSSGELAAYSIKSVEDKSLSFTRYTWHEWSGPKDNEDTSDNFRIDIDELLSYGLASQSTSSSFNNINAAVVGGAGILMVSRIVTGSDVATS